MACGGQQLHGIDKVLDDGLQLPQFVVRFDAVLCRLAICDATAGSDTVSSLHACAPFIHDFSSSKIVTACILGQCAP